MSQYEKKSLIIVGVCCTLITVSTIWGQWKIVKKTPVIVESSKESESED